MGRIDGRWANAMLLHRLLFHAARKAAADPRVKAKAAEVFEHGVKPRAKAAWAAAKPRLQAARDDVREAAATIDPRDDPAGFAGELKRRLGEKRRPGKDR